MNVCNVINWRGGSRDRTDDPAESICSAEFIRLRLGLEMSENFHGKSLRAKDFYIVVGNHNRNHNNNLIMEVNISALIVGVEMSNFQSIACRCNAAREITFLRANNFQIDLTA